LDAQALVGELVPPGSVFAFLAEHRHELFPDSFICDLFSSSTGRPSLPADCIGISVLDCLQCDGTGTVRLDPGRGNRLTRSGR
jgi:hypothetical protein